MNSSCRRGLIGMLALLALAFSPSITSAAPSEASLIADLASPREGVVTDALQELEKKFPTSTNSFSVIKKLLADPRLKVQRKAARVLGSLHAPVDQADVSNICTLLKSSDPATLTDGLKALRGLNAPSAVPNILPLLNHANAHIVRDACRTLAVIGNKDVIPQIEPLLKNPDPAVQKDAQDAIVVLRTK